MSVDFAYDGFRLERGMLWPAHDVKCAAVTFRELEHGLGHVLACCPERRVVIQAGGNCGQWVREFAAAFGTVYTFEPDARNFAALTANTAHLPNVFRFQAGLSDGPRFCAMASGDGAQNCGAGYLVEGGTIPTLTIDALGLEVCDLIYLDIEGSELRALRGAKRTIERCKPIVAFEDKGLGARFFGERRGDVEAWMSASHGYTRLQKLGNDFVMGPS